MKAAIFHAPHEPLTIEEVQIDKPMSREILVRTVANCSSHGRYLQIRESGGRPPSAVCGRSVLYSSRKRGSAARRSALVR